MDDKPDRASWPACNTASTADMSSFERMALQVLSTSGQRVTMPRVQVIRALGESNRALSPYAIHDRILAAGGRIDIVSVYRILAMLQQNGLVHHVGIVDGYIPCRIHGEHDAESQHLVCRECGCVMEVTMDSSTHGATLAQAEQAGFKVECVQIEVLGTCPHCQ